MVSMYTSFQHKNIKLIVLFLNKQTIAKRALVSQMLATANQTYPTVQSFKERLASLYGTQLSTRVLTKGLTHSVDIELT